MGSFVHGRIAAGLSYTRVGQCDESPDGCVATVGVPLEAEIGFRVLPIFGLGVTAFKNLNTKAMYGGVALVAQLGWLGRRR
jgi:hypothetical protein